MGPIQSCVPGTSADWVVKVMTSKGIDLDSAAVGQPWQVGGKYQLLIVEFHPTFRWNCRGRCTAIITKVGGADGRDVGAKIRSHRLC